LVPVCGPRAERFAFRALLADERIPAIETLPSEPSGVSEKGEEERERAERELRSALGETQGAYSGLGGGACSVAELPLIGFLGS
jgi:hypothetical protein